MSDGTPETPAESAAGGSDRPKTPAAKKAPARKAKPTRAARTSTPDAAAAAPAAAAPASTGSIADPEPAPEVTATPVAPTASAPVSPSLLDRVRVNRVGPLTAGLVVAILVGLLLSVLVPNEPSVLAVMILGALLATAVGFTMRYLTTCAGLRRQVEAFIAAAIGVHVMSVTGVVGGELPLLELIGAEGPGFDDALLAALATPPVSTGGILAGLAAAIIVGWGERSPRDVHERHHGH